MHASSNSSDNELVRAIIKNDFDYLDAKLNKSIFNVYTVYDTSIMYFFFLILN